MPPSSDSARPLTNRERSEIQAGQFEMRSLSMSLVRSGGGQEFNGPGYVSMDADGDLAFTLFDIQGDSRVAMTWWGRRRGWISEDEYFDLEVRELSGRIWQASRIVPYVEDANLGLPGVVLRGTLSELWHRGTREKEGKSSVRSYFPGTTKLPLFQSTKTTRERGDQAAEGYARDHQGYEAAGFRVHLETVEDGFWVSVRPPPSLEATAPHLRSEESIWLLVGTPLHASLVETWYPGDHIVRIRPRKPARFKPRLTPPIPLSDPRFSDSHGELLCRYLAYVWEHPVEAYHPVSTRVFDVLRASSLSVVAEARAVSIAVETLAKGPLAELAPVSAKHKSAVSDLKDYLGDWKGDPRIRDRAIGAVGNFSTARAGDVLRAAEALGLLTGDEFRDWTKLRNSSAHGDDPKGPITEFADRSERVWGLFSKLVFQIIRFDGEWVAPGVVDGRSTPFAPVSVPGAIGSK